jgi:hypothetical protein
MKYSEPSPCGYAYPLLPKRVQSARGIVWTHNLAGAGAGQIEIRWKESQPILQVGISGGGYFLRAQAKRSFGL